MTTTESRPELLQRLQAILDERAMLKHPFYQAWVEGKLPRGVMAEYARQYYPFEVAFPRYLSAIHARTESPRIRQLLLDNLWDEEHGERNHPALWLEFAAALGVSGDAVMKAKLRPSTQRLVEHFREVCTQAPIAEGLATLYAFEGQVPGIAWQTIKGLSDHYGFTPHQFEFFSVHLVADLSHSGAELEAIGSACEDEERVLAAARTGCDLLLAFLDGCMETAGS